MMPVLPTVFIFENLELIAPSVRLRVNCSAGPSLHFIEYEIYIVDNTEIIVIRNSFIHQSQ